MELTVKERSFLERISRQQKVFLTASIVSVAVALSLLIYYGLIAKELSSLRFVIIILVLLAGKSHLRQYRSAVLLHKFKNWNDRKE